MDRWATVGTTIMAIEEVLQRWATVEAAGKIAAQAGNNIDRRGRLAGLAGEVQGLMETIDRWETVRDRWANVERARVEMQILETAKARLDLLVQRSDTLERANIQIAAQEEILERLAGLDIATALAADVATWATTRAKLLDLGIRFKQADAAVATERLHAGRWKDTGQAEQFQAAARSGEDRRAQLLPLGAKWYSVTGNIRQAAGAAILAENRVAELEGAYRDQLSAAGVCPTCGTKITTKILKEAI
jgi:hypothetical protein